MYALLSIWFSQKTVNYGHCIENQTADTTHGLIMEERDNCVHPINFAQAYLPRIDSIPKLGR